MASPASDARAKVKAAHPEAVVVERGRNSIKHRLADAPNGRKRYALDVAIGPLHYGPDNDQEIDTALVPSTAPWNWEMTKAGFEVRALSDLSAGQVIEYRSGSEWVRFQPMALQYSNDLNQIQQISMPQSVDVTVDDDTLTWADGYGPGRTLTWQAQTARLAKLLTIGSLADLPTVDQFILDGGNPVLELNLIFAFSSGVAPYVNGQPWGKGGQAQDRDTQGLVEFRDGDGNILWWFNLPRSWDADGNEQLGTLRFKKQGNSLYVSHRVPLGFVQGAVYPLMVDVTVDEQVGAGTDDAHQLGSGSNADITSDQIGTLNSDAEWGGFRWSSVAVPKDATIDAANCQFYFPNLVFDEPLHDLEFEAHDDAPTFTTGASDIEDRTLPGSARMWSDTNLGAPGWFTSPSLTGQVGLITGRAGWASGQALVLVVVQPTTDPFRDWQVRSYDFDTSLAAKLHIEYTAGGGTPVTATIGVPIEFLQGIAKITIPPIESVGIVVNAKTNPIESLQGISKTSQKSLESLGRVAQTVQFPFESRGRVVVVAVLPFEAVQGVRATVIPTYESLQGNILQTLVIPYEAVQGVRALVAPPYEAAGTVKQTILVLYESIESVIATAVLSFEALKGNILKTVAAPYEALEGVRQTAIASVEAAGTIIVTLAMPIESTVGIIVTSVLPYESLQGVAKTAVVVLESLGRVSATAQALYEARGRIAVIITAPYEASGRVVSQVTVPLEALQGIIATSNVPIESVAGILSSVGVQYEASQGIRSVSVISIESLKSIAASTTFPYEALQSVVAMLVAPYEALQGVGVQATVIIPYESLLGTTPFPAKGFAPSADVSPEGAASVPGDSSIEEGIVIIVETSPTSGQATGGDA